MKVIRLTTFNELGLAEPILKAITEAGYDTPTPIQLKAIPPVAQGLDVLGIAQTGTGKTAAFALPILHRLAADRRPAPPRGIRCLVLSPTRELATQIAESFRTYGRHLGFTVATVFGGVSERPQAQMLARGVDILVATPGRLLDHISQRNVSLGGAEVFVLDEADQMLDLGFFRPIRKIVSYLPAKRQNLFFSATMPKEIEDLTRELLRDPVKVAVAPTATTAERVEQKVILIEQNKKRSLLVELLADKAMQRTLVFTRTKRGADRVAKHLVGAGVPVSAIHGNKSQNQREAALDAFKDGKIRVLVATDIAARGIDVDEVTHVVNFDLPDVPEAYVHRIGRTARAGETGQAVAFCSGEERHLLRDIERVTRQQIPNEDRRNDANLVGDKPGEARDARDSRDQRGDRGGGNRSGAHRGGGARPGHRGNRPAYKGGDERRDDRRDERPAVIHAGASAGYRDRDDRKDDRRDERPARPAHTGPRPQHGDRPSAPRGEGRPFAARGERRPEDRDQSRQRTPSDRRSDDRGHDRPRPHGDGPRPYSGERPRHGQHEPRGDRRPDDRRPEGRSQGDRSQGERPRNFAGERPRQAQGEPRGERRPEGNHAGHDGHRSAGDRGGAGHRGPGKPHHGGPARSEQRGRPPQRAPYAGQKG